MMTGGSGFAQDDGVRLAQDDEREKNPQSENGEEMHKESCCSAAMPTDAQTPSNLPSLLRHHTPCPSFWSKYWDMDGMFPEIRLLFAL